MEPTLIDKKDRDIIFELSMNARASITHLAQKVKLSKQVVSYRLQQLEKKKVIEGYYAITNPYRLGLTHYRLYMKFQNMSEEKEKEFIDHVQKNKKVVWVVYLDGDLDAALGIWAKNIREFEEVYDDIKEHYGTYLLESHFSVSTKIEYLRYKFLNNSQDMSSLLFGGCYQEIRLDELDKKILQDLNKKGRITLVELANKYKSSAKVVRARITSLIKNKVIIGFNVKINHNLLGYTHRKVFLKLNTVQSEKLRELSTYLKSLKSTIYLVKPIGESDFEVELMTESNQEFHEFMKELRTRFAKEIKSDSSVIHYEEPKSGQL